MKNKRPLKRSIIFSCILFIVILCLLLGITTYQGYKKSLYARYEAYISDVLNYVADSIDVDDLKDCLEKGEKSEKFDELQVLFDRIKDTHKIDFLYVIIPQHPGEHDNIMNVIAGMSSYEKEYVPENVVELGELTGDSYPAETAAKYYNAMNASSIVFFEEVAEWGDDYTGIKSLRTSDGAFFAELCVDVPVQEIHETILNHMMENVGLILVIGILFIVAFIIWSSHNIVTPILKLEKSVTEYAAQTHGQKFIMEAPDIQTHNEIESLASAVKSMADDINAYVTEIVEAERVATEMRNLVNTDALTGIKNRAAFASYIQEYQERIDHGEMIEFAIAVFDCDDLKGINDQYGEDKGDIYLKTTSQLICRIFENSPAFRVGGDEFIVVLQGEDYQNREELADQFYRESDSINASTLNEWEQVRTAMGIAVFEPELDRTMSDTVRRADKFMYDNKRGGTRSGEADGQPTFFMESDEIYWKERYILDSFKTALDQHWIKVYYQPIMRIKNGSLVVLEALARWIDPVRGMISPNEFIYILSRYHRLHMLDMYMIEEVCREFCVRGEAGLPLGPVSVNISAQDFDYIDVPSKLKEITEKYGLESKKIIVEITEQDIAEGTDHFKEALKQIRANGFRLWIDDFGSGYSSLNVLSQYDVDRIKFDMELVRHLDDNDSKNRRILEGMVKVCKDLGIGTLAEGIETETQLNFLKEIDCDLAQGFYFYKPEPADVSIYKFNHRPEDIPHEMI